MRLFNWLFKKKVNNNTVSCPRCLGKGKVDEQDIKRLGMELKWATGRCAYCNGVGKVAPAMIANVAVDEAYLTTDLTDGERLRLINRDPETIMRAVSYEKATEDFINHIRHLYFNRNMSVEEVARYQLDSGLGMDYEVYMQQKKELMDYINRVVGASS